MYSTVSLKQKTKAMLSPEELLRPRFKVIAKYPDSTYRLGQIIKYHEKHWHPFTVTGWRKLFDPYPHLFKKLEWWEERKPEDMPEYVKLIEYDRRFFVYHSDEDPIPEDYPKLNTVLKLGQDFQWIMTDKIPYAVLICEQGYELFADTLAPATPDEYLTYKQQRNG